jgi:hypothetical protein
MLPEMVQRQYESPSSSSLFPATDVQAEFLRGESTTDECESLYKDYKKCLEVGLRSGPCSLFHYRANPLQKALRERGIDSMLEDAREDNKDTDAEHLRRRCKHLIEPHQWRNGSSKHLTTCRSSFSTSSVLYISRASLLAQTKGCTNILLAISGSVKYL